MRETTHPTVIITHPYRTPCGTLLLGSLGESLCLCDWQREPHAMRVAQRLQRTLHATFADGTSAVLEEAARQLDEYFAGQRRTFSVPLRFAGSDFQCAVWHDLLRIPYGQTMSYADLARGLGRPKAVRAVANANGANALSIFIPCHRVIGSNHTLTGYGGGLAAKRWLLAHEGIVVEKQEHRRVSRS